MGKGANRAGAEGAEDEMKKTARVVNENGVLMAEVLREEACAHCRGCGLGRRERLLYPLNGEGFHEGDEITLELSGRTLSKTSLLAYGLPLACLIAGLLLGGILFSQEWAQALSAILMLGVGFAVLAATEKKRKAGGQYVCRAEKTNPPENG